jgi:hypothetical protein
MLGGVSYGWLGRGSVKTYAARMGEQLEMGGGQAGWRLEEVLMLINLRIEMMRPVSSARNQSFAPFPLIEPVLRSSP